MKKINSLSLSLTFAGCFLGAGYLSGNELVQFFSGFGLKGIIGCFLALAGITVFGILILYIADKKKTAQVENIIMPFHSPKLGTAVGVAQAILVFAVAVIMAAGASTLVQESTGINRIIVSAVFCIVLAVVTSLGIGGMATFFSFLVPAIAICTLCVCGYFLFGGGVPQFSVTVPETLENPLLSHWILSAISYLSYSIFASAAIIAPVAEKLKGKHTYIYGTVLGGMIMFIIALSIMLTTACVPESLTRELPMHAVAQKCNPALGAVYAVLLFGGMFGTALTSCVALVNYIKLKAVLSKKYTYILIWITAVLVFVGSLCGFGDLIGTVYPLYGYIGIILLIFIVINFVKIIKQNRNIDFKKYSV